MGVLMQASVIEIAARADIDLNRELRALGIGNALGSLAGGMAGYHSLSTSLLSIRIGSPDAGHRPDRRRRYPAHPLLRRRRHRLAAEVAHRRAAVLRRPRRADLGVAQRSPAPFLARICGRHAGVRRRRLRRTAGGARASALPPAWCCSSSTTARWTVVRHESSAVEHHSNVVRSMRARQLLDELGDRVMILELQGYIFFGTSNLLLNRIRTRLSGEPRPHFILLDFRRVTGHRFYRFRSVSTSSPSTPRHMTLTLIASGLSSTIAPDLRAPGAARSTRRRGIRLFPDLDHGLEYAENRLLAAARPARERRSGMERQLAEAGGGSARRSPC